MILTALVSYLYHCSVPNIRDTSYQALYKY